MQSLQLHGLCVIVGAVLSLVLSLLTLSFLAVLLLVLLSSALLLPLVLLLLLAMTSLVLLMLSFAAAAGLLLLAASLSLVAMSLALLSALLLALLSSLPLALLLLSLKLSLTLSSSLTLSAPTTTQRLGQHWHYYHRLLPNNCWRRSVAAIHFCRDAGGMNCCRLIVDRVAVAAVFCCFLWHLILLALPCHWHCFSGRLNSKDDKWILWMSIKFLACQRVLMSVNVTWEKSCHSSFHAAHSAHKVL